MAIIANQYSQGLVRWREYYILLHETVLFDELVDSDLGPFLKRLINLGLYISIVHLKMRNPIVILTSLSSGVNLRVTISISFGGSCRIGSPSNVEFFVRRRRRGFRIA